MSLFSHTQYGLKLQFASSAESIVYPEVLAERYAWIMALLNFIFFSYFSFIFKVQLKKNNFGGKKLLRTFSIALKQNKKLKKKILWWEEYSRNISLAFKKIYVFSCIWQFHIHMYTLVIFTPIAFCHSSKPLLPWKAPWPGFHVFVLFGEPLT